MSNKGHCQICNREFVPFEVYHIAARIDRGHLIEHLRACKECWEKMPDEDELVPCEKCDHIGCEGCES